MHSRVHLLARSSFRRVEAAVSYMIHVTPRDGGGVIVEVEPTPEWDKDPGNDRLWSFAPVRPRKESVVKLCEV